MGSYLLLGCDGVWETRRTSQETVDAASSFLPKGKGALSTCLSKLLMATLAKDQSTGGGLDNMTSVLVKLPQFEASTKNSDSADNSKSGSSSRRARTVVLPVRSKTFKRPSSSAASREVRQNILKRPSARR